MDVRRSITCAFWTDDWIEGMTTEEKLLFLYVLTNPLSNILGIYKISLNRIAFETGIEIEVVISIIKGFERLKKIFYIDGYIIIVNHVKHQSLNPNMKINIVKDFNELPNSLKSKLNGNTSEGFQSLSKSLEMLSKIEIEIESEIEKKNRKALSFDDCKLLLLSNEMIDWRKNMMEDGSIFKDDILKDLILKFVNKQKSKVGYFPKKIDEVQNHFSNWLAKQNNNSDGTGNKVLSEEF